MWTGAPCAGNEQVFVITPHRAVTTRTFDRVRPKANCTAARGFCGDYEERFSDVLQQDRLHAFQPNSSPLESDVSNDPVRRDGGRCHRKVVSPVSRLKALLNLAQNVGSCKGDPIPTSPSQPAISDKHPLLMRHTGRVMVGNQSPASLLLYPHSCKASVVRNCLAFVLPIHC